MKRLNICTLILTVTLHGPAERTGYYQSGLLLIQRGYYTATRSIFL